MQLRLFCIYINYINLKIAQNKQSKQQWQTSVQEQPKNNGSKVDRRIAGCANCTKRYPLNCIGMIQTIRSTQGVLNRRTATAFLVSQQLAVTCSRPFIDIIPETKQVIIVPPRLFYLGFMGDISIDAQRFLDSQIVYQITDYRIHAQYERIIRQIAQLQKIIEQGNLNAQEKQHISKRIDTLTQDSQKYDFALIKLKKHTHLGKYMQLNWQGLENYINVKIQGYQLREDGEHRQINQLFHTGPVEVIGQYSIFYDIDTVPQQVGSPVLSSVFEDAKVVAIHRGFDSKAGLNVGIKITAQLIGQIQQWNLQLNSSFILYSIIKKPQDKNYTPMPQITPQILKDKDIPTNQLQQQTANMSRQLAKKDQIIAQHKIIINNLKINQEQLYQIIEKARQQNSQLKNINFQLQRQVERLKQQLKRNDNQYVQQRKRKVENYRQQPTYEIQKIKSQPKQNNLIMQQARKETGKFISEPKIKVQQLKEQSQKTQLNPNLHYLSIPSMPSIQSIASRQVAAAKRKNESDYVFAWDQSTKYARNFSIQGKKARMNKEFDDNWYQLTGKHPLPRQSITTFRLINYKVSLIMGILVEQKKQGQCCGGKGADQKGSAGYWTTPNHNGSKGAVFVDGQQKFEWQTSSFIQKGGLLEMMVDLAEPNITFVNKQNKSSHKINLASYYKEQKVYIFVVMRDKDDLVQIV